MNYTNIPNYGFAVPVPADAYPYFVASLVLFAAYFFISLHWWLHVRQHGFPPFYVLRLKNIWGRLVR